MKKQERKENFWLPSSMKILLASLFFVFGNPVLVTPSNAQTTLPIKRIIPVPTPRPDGTQTPSRFQIPPVTSLQTFPNEEVTLNLSAVIGPDKTPVGKNIVWRIFSDEKGPDGKLALYGTYTEGELSILVPAGYYIIHASFGYAGVAERVSALPPLTEKTFELKAGALRLNAAFREGDFIPSKDLSFDIARNENNTLQTVVSGVLPDEIVRLSPGDYHVLSKYGKINSEAGADVRVKNNQLTELTIYQRGAEITLKLVSTPGGEALANTRWTVLTPGGDVILDSVASAFPSMILAMGEYEAYAVHEGKEYRGTFTVESGVHREVEVLIK